MKLKKVCKIHIDDLSEALKVTPQQRLREANCAFRLYLSLHNPYAKPGYKFFNSLKDFNDYEKKHYS
ncbi:MAG: hypothetical protein AB1633_00580 [Elusimicrobiota bacterium]